MHKPLPDYKASAGSGKTFRLALEYIKLLIGDPSAYRRILAVTFTNKATEEMKMRILTQLYGISRGLGDRDTLDYINIIAKELNVGEETVRQRAATALNNLLHNNSYFRVETIDSFFQSVLRNLARELDLTANLRVELNDREVEQQAVDELIESLSAQSMELSWIMGYIQENMEDDKSWNVIGQIKKFGENIFKDVYKLEHERLNEVLHNKDFFKSYVGRLNAIKKDAENELLELAEAFFSKLGQHGLSIADFSNGERGVAGYFVKLQRGIFDDKVLTETVKTALDDPMKWLKKADQVAGSPLYEAVTGDFDPLLHEAEKKRPKCYRLYKSAQLTLRHQNQLRLLNSIDKRVHEMNKTAGRFLLSDTQALLNLLISESDSPFIFEKIGTQLDHIMIDEFQDTSVIQWKNFKVLLRECMSRENAFNLIVGDVKQSIYRWRAGDWRLLNDIEQQFAENQIKAIPMQTNFRSEKHVIDFNNAFFDIAKDMECKAIGEENASGAQQLEKAYADVEQRLGKAKNDEGFVQIELLDDKSYAQRTFEKIKETIADLLGSGVNPKDIAILVRANQTIQDIADFMMDEMPDVRLVSDEAFRLDASLAVNVLVEAMRGLSQPENMIVRAHLAKTYQQKILATDLSDSRLFQDIDDINSLLPKAYTDEADALRTLPIYELCEQLYKIFSLERVANQSAYVCAFYDRMNKFLADNMADLDMFLEAWDEEIHKKTIQSDSIDGIRLLTIHKSKGLEFENVLMPFCDWRLERSTLIWCRPGEDDTPFNELPLIPIDYSASQMRGTIFDNDYQHEHLQNTVDNLNLLYVGFTRARQNLFVIGKKGQKGIRSQLIEDVLAKLPETLPDCTLTDEADCTLFTFGQPTHKTKTEDESENIFRKPATPVEIRIESFENKAKFRQSNSSRAFVGDEQADEQQNAYIQLGSVLHAILSTIRTTADIPRALQQLEMDGVLYDNIITRPKLAAMLKERLEHPQVANWFSERWHLFNECAILYTDPDDGPVRQKRPDRVMTDGSETIVVDFKFASPDNAHHRQVSHYVELLNRMGLPGVRGYLWYVYSNRIEDVKNP